jgi:hypothetical protein
MKGRNTMKRFLSVLASALVLFPAGAYAQKAAGSETDPRTTEAYSLLIQRKVKVQAELESLLSEYTSDWPKAKRLQFELDTLKTEMKKMSEVVKPEVLKLTSGFGSLILRKVSLATDIHMLAEEQGVDWPLLKDKQRELELLEKEILKLAK